MYFRKEIRTIHMRNNTQLPVVWKVTGIEQLGDDFTLSADHGVIEPLQEYPLHAYFRAMKPLNTTQQKKIRLEVSTCMKRGHVVCRYVLSLTWAGRHRSFKDEFCAQTEKKWSDHNNDEKQLYIYTSVGP